MNENDLEIKVGDRVEVHEGSWAGDRGEVIDDYIDIPGRVWVRFDDGTEGSVVACTLGKEVKDNGENHKAEADRPRRDR